MKRVVCSILMVVGLLLGLVPGVALADGVPGPGEVGDHFDPAQMPVGWLVDQHSGKCVGASSSSVGAKWQLQSCQRASSPTVGQQSVTVTADGQLQLYTESSAMCAGQNDSSSGASVISVPCLSSATPQQWAFDSSGHICNRVTVCV